MHVYLVFKQTRRAIQDSWNEAGLDVVLCPPQVGAAPPLGSSDYLLRKFLQVCFSK